MELDDLYQDLILDHFKHPRNQRPLAEAEVLVDEENPTCGDHIRLMAKVEQGKIVDVKFEGKGCAISTASASMMTERLIGMPVEAARRLISDFVGLIRGEKEVDPDELGDLAALEGVKQYPMRVKCATMCWHAVETALNRIHPPA
ncbi:MAG TPA: SUF system NifU family Fe-S cluster assembly protein [Kiritimatiellia bacterium]|nr:SUF system NifU family Fe-S cluster assembly protein [Kiritimatiellia bacterium]